MTKLFKTPFAAQGDRKDVPVETQADGSGAHTHSISGTAASAGAHTHTIGGYANGSGPGPKDFSTARSQDARWQSLSAGAHTHTVSGTAASAGAHTHTIAIGAHSIQYQELQQIQAQTQHFL